MRGMYLVEVDDGLPEVVLLLVEVPHTNLTEVTRVVLNQTNVSIRRRISNGRPRRLSVVVVSGGSRSNLVHVGTVVVLTTGKTTTTGVLAVLAYTSLTGGDVAAAVKSSSVHLVLSLHDMFSPT